MEQYINIFRIYDKIMKNYLDIYSLFLIGYLFSIYKIDKWLLFIKHSTCIVYLSENLFQN